MQNSKPFPREPPDDIFPSPIIPNTQMAQITKLFQCPSEPTIVTIDLGILQEMSVEKRKEWTAYYLTPEEKHKLAGFKFAKRQIEWLAGRIAAKKAALLLLPRLQATTRWHDLRINTTRSGRPFCEINQLNKLIIPDISITHSGNRAMAMASLKRLCGIDIQKITTKITKLKDRFATPQEEEILSSAQVSATPEALLTMLWSAKEATRKAFPSHPLPGFMELRLCQFRGGSQYFIGQFTSQRLGMPAAIPFFAFFYHNYSGALTINQSFPCPIMESLL